MRAHTHQSIGCSVVKKREATVADVSIETLAGDGRFNAYQAAAEAAPKGAIIVIQEIFGINPGIRAKVEHWASLGYAAYAPDLFWRFAPGVQLDPDVPEQFQQALGLMRQLDFDKAIGDIEATIRYARSAAGGKVGVVGFCLGGLLAYLSAARTDVDASVGYYGGGIDQQLNESHAIAKPLLLHFAEQDHFIDAAAREKTAEALRGNRHVRIETYPGVDHGFATTAGKRRNDAMAELADGRTEAFFAAHLA
jgi:carboxymethylenebutenolidase